MKKRNPIANNPLLRKGGVHSSSKGSMRSCLKISLNLAVNQWLEDCDIDTFDEKEKCLSDKDRHSDLTYQILI
ncbi:MAG: hypothetical protein D6B27_05410 [Gammaproteobacteria bacterium]|nr:MAG: hypothetical protein D6B27_05410 [Gammaproteobacteria bacterium]